MMKLACTLHLCRSALLLLLFSTSCRAEITLLRADPQGGSLLSRFNLRVGGDIRMSIYDVMGGKDRGSYQRNLFDGGSRLRFHLRYQVDDDFSLVGYAETGVNSAELIGWHGHYAEGARNTSNRQLFAGVRSQRWGEFTWGHRDSIYYQVVTAKTDIWGNDMHTEPVENGMDANADGSWHARRSLNYLQHFGPVDLYASYLFPVNPYYSRGARYKRHDGQSLGIDDHLTSRLSWGLAWNRTRASMSDAQQQRKRFDQQILGTGFSWKPGHWTVAATGGWFRNFTPLAGRPLRRYFATRAWGLSYFIGRDFAVNRYGLKSIMPIYFGAQLRAGQHRERYQRENGLGVEFFLYKGFRFDYQHVFRSSNDHIGDLNLFRLRYDF
ncbi:porin [Erwinia aphidicola]|uniref:Porin n=2 Tax=Erwinia aphidicola TaxID=68334 RepID=A0ABU8DN90_ERWAP